MVVSNNFEEDEAFYSSLVPFKVSSSHTYRNKNYKNAILEIIFEIKNSGGGSDNDNKGTQTSGF